MPIIVEEREDNADHQLLAFLSCIIFWPIGLLAIYYANMVSIEQENVQTSKYGRKITNVKKERQKIIHCKQLPASDSK